ncbi:MAG TPA: hypothetical protein VFR43_08125 [Gaiellaceae bacterium]|nr:hypothetical protein [Gaiellaceae bacterium]
MSITEQPRRQDEQPEPGGTPTPSTVADVQPVMPVGSGVERALRMLRRFWWVGLLAVGGLYWFWDSTHHDHPGPHGAPLTVAQAEQGSLGTFTADDGTTTDVTDASCAGGEDGNDSGTTFTHFRCSLTFASGETDVVVVHVTPDGLEFWSEKS